MHENWAPFFTFDRAVQHRCCERTFPCLGQQVSKEKAHLKVHKLEVPNGQERQVEAAEDEVRDCEGVQEWSSRVLPEGRTDGEDDDGPYIACETEDGAEDSANEGSLGAGLVDQRLGSDLVRGLAAAVAKQHVGEMRVHDLA